MADIDRLQLDILAKMGEEWTDTTDAMMTLAIGLCMLASEQEVIDFRIDQESVTHLLTTYTLDREYHSIYGVPYMRVSLTRKEVTSNGPSTANAEVTSETDTGNVVETPKR